MGCPERGKLILNFVNCNYITIIIYHNDNIIIKLDYITKLDYIQGKPEPHEYAPVIYVFSLKDHILLFYYSNFINLTALEQRKVRAPFIYIYIDNKYF